MDPVFLPRTLIRVERLPRTDNGKLPRAALDRVYGAQAARKTRRGTMSRRPPASSSSWPARILRCPGTFPGRPIVPGVLLLDEVLARHRGRRRAAGGRPAAGASFVSALLPGETAQVEPARSTADRVKFVVQAQRDGVAATLASGSVLLSPGVPPP